MTDPESTGRKGAEGELFRLLVENVKDYAIFALDPQGRVKSWNPGAERLLGYREGEIVGRPASVLFTPEDIGNGVPEREMREALEEGRGNDDRWHVRKDGSRFWSGGTMTPLWDEARTLRGFAKIMRDRTEWKRAEDSRLHAEALARHTEERFRSLVEQAPFSVQVFSPDGRTVRVNRAWEELWGLTPDQIGDYNVLEDRQLERKGVLDFIRRGFAGEVARVPAVRYDPNETIPDRTRHDDPVRWVAAIIYPIKDAAGEVREVVLVHDDITARVNAEGQVRASERRFRQLADAMPQVVWTARPDGTIDYLNGRWAKLTGLTETAGNGG